MTRRRRAAPALALAVTVALSACSATSAPTPSPVPAGTPSPRIAATDRQPRSAAPTPPTILAIELRRRPSGPWAVTFTHPGREGVREVYVLAPACGEPTCDLTATIQTFDGQSIGTGVFTYTGGTYRYEADRTETIDCSDGFGGVSDGANLRSHTSLLIAAYRSPGISAIPVDIRGTRSVDVIPTASSSCPASSIDYLANGEATQFAAAPTASPKSTPAPTVPVVKDAYFGAGATVETYLVTGSTSRQIIASIDARGPWSEWAHARAEALTRAVPRNHFALSGDGDLCRVKITATPAVDYAFTITLPNWSPPNGVDPATVRWWANEIERVSAHENHHVDIFREGARQLSDAIARSTCTNVSTTIATIANDISRRQCEFDLKEYGAALGLTLQSCLSH